MRKVRPAAAYHRTNVQEATAILGKQQQAAPPPTPPHHLKITLVNKVEINQEAFL
jgi:hypothetical protein